MKKKLSILLVMIMVLSMVLVGCGDKPADDDNKGKDDTTKNEANDENEDDDADTDSEDDNADANAEIEYDFEVTDFTPMGIEDLNLGLHSTIAQRELPAGIYSPISGGIYAVEEDALVPLPLFRVDNPAHPGLTYVPIAYPSNWQGHALLNHVEVDDGFELMIDGVFAGNGITFKVTELRFVYTNGIWVEK